MVYISAGHTKNAAEAKSVVNAVITQNRKLLNRVIVMTYALVQGKWSSIADNFKSDEVYFMF